MHRIRRFAIPLAVIYLTAVFVAWGTQHWFVFNNSALPTDHVFHFNSLATEEVWIPATEDAPAINALYFKTEGPRKGLIVYHHGNRGTLQRWGTYAPDLLQHGYDVLMYDYRGYGKTPGPVPTEEMLYADAERVYQYAVSRCSADSIVIMGRSLGSGVAAWQAQQHLPRALILETPYADFAELMGLKARWMPARWLASYRMSTRSCLAELKCPILVLHGTADKLIPLAHAQKLISVLQFPRDRFVVIAGGTHGNLREFAAYHKALAEMLR